MPYKDDCNTIEQVLEISEQAKKFAQELIVKNIKSV
jgi:hypothetical protein